MWSAFHKKRYLTNLEVRNLKSEISCLCPVWLSQFCLFWKKIGKGFMNIPKFVNSTHNKYLFSWHADHIKIQIELHWLVEPKTKKKGTGSDVITPWSPTLPGTNLVSNVKKFFLHQTTTLKFQIEEQTGINEQGWEKIPPCLLFS